LIQNEMLPDYNHYMYTYRLHLAFLIDEHAK